MSRAVNGPMEVNEHSTKSVEFWSCRRCTLRKHLSLFRANQGSLTGRRYVCLQCELEIARSQGLTSSGPNYGFNRVRKHSEALLTDFCLSLDRQLDNGSKFHEFIPASQMSPLEHLIAKEEAICGMHD